MSKNNKSKVNWKKLEKILGKIANIFMLALQLLDFMNSWFHLF